MKKTITLCCLLVTLFTNAQQNIGIGTTTPNAAAALDITATGKGILIPRMDSVTRVGIANPPDGLMVFQNDGRKGFWYAINNAWLFIPDKANSGDNLGNHTATQNVVLNSNDIQLRAAGDSNHGLGWYGNSGSAKNWVGQNIDGPVLYGNIAGVLGTTSNGKKSILKWTRDGRVGIGTASPFSQLANTSVNTIGTDGAGGNPGSLAWAATQDGYVGQIFNGSSSSSVANGLAVKVSSATATALDVSQGNQTSAGLPLLTVKSDGKVGIGTSAPTESLEVNGNITYTGNLKTGLVFKQAQTTVGVGGYVTGTLYCDAGTRLIGGGGGSIEVSGNIGFQTIYNGPSPNSNLAWAITVYNNASTPSTLRLYCICAKVE